MIASLAAGMGAAEWAARWFRHIGWGHLDTAHSRSFPDTDAPGAPGRDRLYLTGWPRSPLSRCCSPTGPRAAGPRRWRGRTAPSGHPGLHRLLVLTPALARRRRDALSALLCCLSAVGVAAALTAGPVARGAAGRGSRCCGADLRALLPYAWVVLRPSRTGPTPDPGLPG
ncbi:hypothetical protein GXW82_28085 [Streptacidiphilus sp. 4-A2]|nr:hypothetical protein [Streptacidiphilus sp. 4-A2]